MSCDCCVALLLVPWVCLQFVIVVFPDYAHLLCCPRFLVSSVCVAVGWVCEFVCGGMDAKDAFLKSTNAPQMKLLTVLY